MKPSIPADPRGLPAMHPGEMLSEEVLPGLEALGVPRSTVAGALGIEASALNELLSCRASMTPEMALRWSRYLGTSAEVWMNQQIAWDLERTKEQLGDALAAIVPAPRDRT